MHRHRKPAFLVPLLAASFIPNFASAVEPEDVYRKIILADNPVAFWRFNTNPTRSFIDGKSLFAKPAGKVKFNVPGPRVTINGFGHLNFTPTNTAASFDALGARLVTNDPGDESPLDFKKGDAITIEAWVNLKKSIPHGQQAYIIGKGRTGRPGFNPHNQNWALRLRSNHGTAGISFLFRSKKNTTTNQRGRGAPDSSANWHRWTSTSLIAPNSGWHHIAVTYRFGHGSSIMGYIDGRPVSGKWDMGGKTNNAPVVDNDQVWIGSSMGGSPASSFIGQIDEVAIYRKALSRSTIAKRFVHKPRPRIINKSNIPANTVRVQIFENVADRRWNPLNGRVVRTYNQPAFAFTSIPNKYNSKGVIDDRSNPYLIRATALIDLQPGDHRLLLRSINGARLFIDGKLITTTRFTSKNASGHESVPDTPDAVDPRVEPLPAGHAQKVPTFQSKGDKHVIELEFFIGGKGIRAEPGFTSLSIASGKQIFTLLSPLKSHRIPMTPIGWKQIRQSNDKHIAKLNRHRRTKLAIAENSYWQSRHQQAREFIAKQPTLAIPPVTYKSATHNTIDRYINHKLAASKVEPPPALGDLAFLRRVPLDTIGLTPSPKLIKQFLTYPKQTRRTQVIRQLLKDPRHADHWVSYWQDVLAENPGILKPMLNNTGPFRWWIYESLRDNKPMDRFVTELIMMEGSKYFGGAAGFSMATQNDVPMAAKAAIVSQAFLGLEMKCARCHDAPFHDSTQKELFNLAAMLKRSPQSIPKTSSIPLSPKEIDRLIVSLSVKPGQSIKPDWPFAKTYNLSVESLPNGVLRNPKDTREQLAALISSPRNKRFAKVLVNRIWRRYLGIGLVEPVDDWQDAKPSHPKLLEYLAREFITSGYDANHISFLILNSHTYQRRVDASRSLPSQANHHTFASPVRRRLSAEQVVDSLFAIADKSFNSEPMTMDREGRRPITAFINLGTPRRAWMFTSLSNERDRPSLSLPRARTITDVLKTFGWRESRQNPLTVRNTTPTIQQPAMIANSVVTRRISGLSDDSAFTRLAINAKSPEAFIEATYRRILTRRPNPDELKLFTNLLRDGFDKRMRKPSSSPTAKPNHRTAVSWSNHLSPEANAIQLAIERSVAEGDAPTQRLDPDWCQRAEDMIWALLNSPEFIFIP